MGVLKLAKKWDLISLRDKAVQQSDTQVQLKTPIEKILLARQYGVGKWLNEAYVTLASREENMTFEEIGQVGWETFGMLMIVRERKWRVPAPTPTATMKCTGCQATSINCYTCCAHGRSYVVQATVTYNGVVGDFDYAAAVKDVFGDVAP